MFIKLKVYLHSQIKDKVNIFQKLFCRYLILYPTKKISSRLSISEIFGIFIAYKKYNTNIFSILKVYLHNQ